jgi:hypothetical protein
MIDGWVVAVVVLKDLLWDIAIIHPDRLPRGHPPGGPGVAPGLRPGIYRQVHGQGIGQDIGELDPLLVSSLVAEVALESGRS